MAKKVKTFLFILLISALIFIVDFTYMDVFIKNTKKLPNRVVILDAGHGGIDGGAIGKNGLIEKDINLAISLKLKAYIEENGSTCIMIREVDEALYSEYGRVGTRKADDLKKRKDIIKDSKGDIFISVHLNSFPQTQYYGAQVFYPKNDDESKKLAKRVQDELLKVLDRNNIRTEKASDNYYMIKNNGIPSILIECGFLSNPEEEKLLGDENYQNKIAFAIYCGTLRYYMEPK